MLIELRDYVSGDSCGLIKVINTESNIEALNEIEESWTEFNQLEEHDLDSYSVDEFVTWHNEGRVTQIERVFIDHIIQPF